MTEPKPQTSELSRHRPRPSRDGQAELSKSAKLKLAEALGLTVGAPIFFAILNAIDGTRPLVTEFEAGGVTAVVLLKLIEALRAYMGCGS